MKHYYLTKTEKNKILRKPHPAVAYEELVLIEKINKIAGLVISIVEHEAYSINIYLNEIKSKKFEKEIPFIVSMHSCISKIQKNWYTKKRHTGYACSIYYTVVVRKENLINILRFLYQLFLAMCKK